MTQTVYDQIMQIRNGGSVNMCNWPAVQRIAFDSRFYDLVTYIEDDPARYFHFILSGQLPSGEENPAQASVPGIKNTGTGVDGKDGEKQ